MGVPAKKETGEKKGGGLISSNGFGRPGFTPKKEQTPRFFVCVPYANKKWSGLPRGPGVMVAGVKTKHPPHRGIETELGSINWDQWLNGVDKTKGTFLRRRNKKVN